jgi:4-aminobutyrate aminotransferase-like enzyme
MKDMIARTVGIYQCHEDLRERVYISILYLDNFLREIHSNSNLGIRLPRLIANFKMDSNFNNSELYASARKSLLVFGSNFMPDVITKTSGIYLYTASGKKIMDWTSGQMSCLIGHGHPEIVQTLAEHAASLDHLYSGMISPPVIKLAERLTSVLPDGLDKAVFLSTGGESNECAIKLAKMYTGKFEIVGLGASWHGVTSGANGAQYHAGRKGYGPAVRLNYHLSSKPQSFFTC